MESELHGQQVMVYSVRAGWWTVVDTDTDNVVECQGVTVEEKLHWVLYDGYHVGETELTAFETKIKRGKAGFI